MDDSASPYDLLFELERQIARRADELARQHCETGSFPLENWLRAETQVWCEFDSQQQSSLAGHATCRPADSEPEHECNS